MRDGHTGSILAAACPTLKSIYLLDGPADVPGMQPFRDLQTHAASHDNLRTIENEISQGDVINVQFTSGTTGLPKGASLTHRYSR